MSLLNAISLTFITCVLALAQTTIPVPGVTQVFVGDFNNDGKQDLLIAQTVSTPAGLTISVFLGQGDGTFGAPVVTSNVDAYSLTAVADLNGDGKLDLLFSVSTGEGDLSVIALGNGDGTFRTNQPMQIAGQVLVIAVADFNGDGKPDLLAYGDLYTDNLSTGPLPFILFGNGAGTFSRGTGTPTLSIDQENALASPAVIGDVNLDGKADIVTVSDVFLSNGDGTFQVVPWSNSAEMLDLAGKAVLADVNGDGNPDIVYAASIGSGISAVVLFGNGDGTFRLGDFYPLGSTGGMLYSLVIADFNQDGAPDIAAGAGTGLTILANYGDGTFHNSIAVNGLSLGSKMPIGPLTVADFNGDGKLDLAVMDQPVAGGTSATDEVSILLNGAPLLFPVLLGGVVNAASGSHHLAPGSLASAYTLPQPYQPAQAGSLPLPVRLGDNVGIFIDSVNAPLFSISSTQVNFQVPWAIGSGNSPFGFVINGQTFSPPGNWEVSGAAFSPGIFTMNGEGTGQGAVTIANRSTIAAPAGAFPGSSPVPRGQYITILCTGLGLVTNQPVDGAAALADPLSFTESAPKVTIGGQEAVVQFSGLAPGLVGVDQVNAQVPADAPTGDQVPLAIQTVDGSTSNTVTIAVE